MNGYIVMTIISNLANSETTLTKVIIPIVFSQCADVVSI